MRYYLGDICGVVNGLVKEGLVEKEWFGFEVMEYVYDKVNGLDLYESLVEDMLLEVVWEYWEVVG